MDNSSRAEINGITTTTTTTTTTTPTKLWEHSDPKSTEMYKFMQIINQKYGQSFTTYDELYRWSIDDINAFWTEVWHYTGVVGTPFTKVKLHFTCMTPF
jgi:hypothetical protein